MRLKSQLVYSLPVIMERGRLPQTPRTEWVVWKVSPRWLAPLSVLPIDIAKQGGLIPRHQAGPAGEYEVVRVFVKASAVSDTAIEWSKAPRSAAKTFASGPARGRYGATSSSSPYQRNGHCPHRQPVRWVPTGLELVVTGRVRSGLWREVTHTQNRAVNIQLSPERPIANAAG